MRGPPVRASGAQAPSATMSQVHVARVEWSSPLPPAAELAKLEQASPGLNAAERMMRMAEEVHAHRIQVDREAMRLVGEGMTWSREEQRRTGWQGVGLAVLGLLVGAGMAGAGVAWPAIASVVSIVSGGGVVGMVLSHVRPRQAGPALPPARTETGDGAP